MELYLIFARTGAAGVEFASLCEFELADGTPSVLTIPV
jgi:hypothetical protein